MGEPGMMEQLAMLKALADRPLTLPPIFVKITGSITAGLLLRQVLYWMGRTADVDGWFYKRLPEFQNEMCMGEKEFRTARAILKNRKMLQTERRGTPPTVWFRADLKAVLVAINKQQKGESQVDEKAESITAKGQNQLCPKDAAIKAKGQKPHSGEKAELYKEAETTRDYPETTGTGKRPSGSSAKMIAQKQMWDEFEKRAPQPGSYIANPDAEKFYRLKVSANRVGLTATELKSILREHPDWKDWPYTEMIDSQQDLFPAEEIA